MSRVCAGMRASDGERQALLLRHPYIGASAQARARACLAESGIHVDAGNDDVVAVHVGPQPPVQRRRLRRPRRRPRRARRPPHLPPPPPVPTRKRRGGGGLAGRRSLPAPAAQEGAEA